MEQLVYCPFCDGQGIVHKAKVEKLNHTIYICDECDTIWPEGMEVNKENCNRFEDFMSDNGLKPLWSELTEVVRSWDKS
jgi:hypothetical protein